MDNEGLVKLKLVGNDGVAFADDPSERFEYDNELLLLINLLERHGEPEILRAVKSSTRYIGSAWPGSEIFEVVLTESQAVRLFDILEDDLPANDAEPATDIIEGVGSGGMKYSVSFKDGKRVPSGLGSVRMKLISKLDVSKLHFKKA